MSFLQWGDRNRKESPRLLDERSAFACRATRQYFRDQNVLVKLGQIQRLHTGVQRLLAHALRRVQARAGSLSQVASRTQPDNVSKISLSWIAEFAGDPSHGLRGF